jgi:hypothetical protein
MKKALKYLVIGTVILTLLMTTALGDTITKTIEVVYNSVNITVNGTKINADNILYNGTTYVPLRAVSEALGKDVGWDQSTNTASINDKGTVKPPVVDSSSETLSQKNAVAKAESYLDIMPFSKSGLVKQLEYEGFSNDDTTYAVNKISVDWKEQAVLKGKSYLDIMPFSRSGLIEQLEYEGFTSEEATYAVDQIGL